MPLPSQDLRFNVASWAVQPYAIPAVVAEMLDVMPPEQFDPRFQGQYLQTTYFDTAAFALRKARVPKKSYLTLRLRAYSPAAPAGGQYPAPVFALSAKTEDVKYRVEVSPAVAQGLLQEPALGVIGQVLGPDLFARLLALIGGELLVPVVTCTAQRYAVEDDTNRLTLDLNVATDTGKQLPFSVLEFKSTKMDIPPPGSFSPSPQPLSPTGRGAGVRGIRPIKISKFLWATSADGR
jgi:hypothetical protein